MNHDEKLHIFPTITNRETKTRFAIIWAKPRMCAINDAYE